MWGAPIRATTIASAEPIARDYLDENFFSQRIGRLPVTEGRYMAAVASLGDGPQRTADVAAVLGKELQAVSVLRGRLIRAALLLYAPRRGEIDFTVPRCADYVRRRMPETRSSAEILDELREDRV